MADVTINQLNSAPSIVSSLLLPVTDGTSTYKLSISNVNGLAPVQSVAGKTGTVTLTNADVGLGSVENKSSATIRGEITSGNVTTALGFTPYNATNPNGYLQIVKEAAISASGKTSIDFTGIPNWVKRITVMFQGVSTGGTSSIIIQVGTSLGLVATNYLGSAMANATGVGTSNLSTGFSLSDSQNTYIRHGFATILNISSNAWVANGVFGLSEKPYNIQFAGSVDAGGVLSRIRVTTVNGTDTFDAGTINIMYEG